MISEKELTRFLSVAKEAALSTGAFLLKEARSESKVINESGRDIKIAQDMASERIILDYLKGNSHFSILSEENGLMPGKESGITWIVDPLDGSMNYIRDIPLFCVSIGLWHEESPLVGIVYEPVRGELFSGIVGEGAWLGDIPLKVSDINQKEKAVLCTGFPVNTDFSPEGIDRFARDARSYKKIRLLGSAALSVAYVAAGRAEVYHEKDIMLWDIAGAIPILLGAGGKMDIEKASRKYSYHVFISNGHL